MTTRASGERGVALVFVLWVTALLAILAASFTFRTGTQARIARNQYDHARAGALADAGVSMAILGILDRQQDRSWRLDGSVRELSYGGGKIRLRLQDEAGKIDLNYAPPAVLAELLRIATGEENGPALADDIAEWKRNRLAQWRGSEAQPSQALSEPFLAVEELREVPGFTRSIYERVVPFVTVLSRSARIDPLSAPSEVLQSLPGADPRVVDAYVAARRENGPDPALRPALSGLEPYLTNQETGQYISIVSEASAPPDGLFVRDATVSLLAAGGQPFRFVAWREGGAMSAHGNAP
jgi:general secretion pathway protein K